MEDWDDPSVLEAASWRLASQMVRRHPRALRLIRTHPGGGQSDVLRMVPLSPGPGDVRLNRRGTIHVDSRFDGRPVSYEAATWDRYLKADPRQFLRELEEASGLPAPSVVPPSTPRTLTLRLLAALTATAVKSVKPVDIQPGYIDASGHGGGPNPELDLFDQIPGELLAATKADFFAEAGYRFWIVSRGQQPVMAFEQDRGLAWTRHHESPSSVMDLYVESRRDLLITALELLRRSNDR